MATKKDKTNTQTYMHQIISDPFKKSDRTVNDADHLARIFREILFHANVDWDEWNELMEDYLNDPDNGIPKNPRARTNERGNLNKAFASRKMTWKTLLKALYFLDGQDLKVTIELTRGNGDVITNTSDIILRRKQLNRKSKI